MIDKVEIRVKAGDGGRGAVSFRREMYVPFGGPDGGDGGKGGDVVIRVDKSTDNLRFYVKNRLYQAERGLGGGAKKKHGHDGADLILKVPAGTLVTSVDENGAKILLADLNVAGEQIIVAAGGKGGGGNVHYRSSVNQAPRIAQKGETGEERAISLEMRLIADVGIIGYPNAGKSTLLAAASAARPKVADYPFTTLEPVLGVVAQGQESFVLAEIPGLIEGAHLGKGLGIDFLRHAMRTKILLHLLSGDAPSPLDDMIKVNNELAAFDVSLAQRPQIVAVNKIDLPAVQEKMAGIKADLAAAGVKAHFISAATGQGVRELMAAVFETLKRETVASPPAEPGEKVFRPQPRQPRIKVAREGDGFVIDAPGLDRIIAGRGVTTGELRWQLNFQLEKMGINKALQKAGVNRGDKIRCGDLTWEWSFPGEEGRKIGVFGGTFDPVHLGHLMIAEEAKTALDMAEVVLVPAGQPMSRRDENVTPARHRLEMLRLAIEGKPELKISEMEIERKGPSYTVDTIAGMKKLYARGDELYFILGWDSLEQLPDWHEPSRLVNSCYLVAVPRPGWKRPNIKALEGILPGITQKVIWLDKPRVDIGATAIRELAARGEPIDHLVPKTVAEYIRKNKLYINQ
ncbi:MAG: GTPase ObgE [Dehalococcoidales bacterium]|jgi:GTP-binding protein